MSCYIIQIGKLEREFQNKYSNPSFWKLLQGMNAKELL